VNGALLFNITSLNKEKNEAKFSPQSVVEKTRVPPTKFTFCGDFPEAEQRQVP
jgi:hypothetical protein